MPNRLTNEGLMDSVVIQTRMRKLIRSKRTKLYLAADREWTDDISKARAFRAVEEIRAAKRTLGLADVEIYESFQPYSESPVDLTLPL